MIFPALYRFAKNRGLLDDLDFVDQQIHCVVRLNQDGRLLSLSNVEDDSNRVIASVSRIPGRTSKPIACVGADQIARVIPEFDPKAKRFVVQSQGLFRDQLEAVRKARKDSAAAAVVKFLDRIRAKEEDRNAILCSLNEAKVRPTGWLTFQVAGCHDEQLCPHWDSVKSWWREQSQAKPTAKKVREVGCSVTGRMCVPVKTHGTRVKIAPGGRAGGVALVSSDKSAFGSYGFKKALVSPMSREAVEGYIRAVNWLGDEQNSNYHYRTGYAKGDSIFLFWSDQSLDQWNPGKAIEVGTFPELLALEPTPAGSITPIAARRVMTSVHTGHLHSAHAAESKRFYCLSLSGSSARGIIRGWIDESLPVARENVTEWFRDLTVQLDRPMKKDEKVVAESGTLWSRWPLWQLVACLQGKGDSAKEELAQQREQLWEAALLGRPIPLSILSLACRRIPADVHTEGKRKGEWRGVRPERAALIQAILIRMNKRKGNMKTEINLDEQTVAFHCGRLLRLLQSIQTAALGDTNATVVSRFYPGASAMPGGVFGTLMSKVQPHINKIRGDKPKLAGWFDARIAEIVGYIVGGGGFPTTNDPVAQGDFALGFYWQRLSTKKEQPEAEPDETETTQAAN